MIVQHKDQKHTQGLYDFYRILVRESYDSQTVLCHMSLYALTILARNSQCSRVSTYEHGVWTLPGKVLWYCYNCSAKTTHTHTPTFTKQQSSTFLLSNHCRTRSVKGSLKIALIWLELAWWSLPGEQKFLKNSSYL